MNSRSEVRVRIVVGLRKMRAILIGNVLYVARAHSPAATKRRIRRALRKHAAS